MKTTSSAPRKDNLKLELYKGVWIRPDTYDKFIVDEMQTYHALEIPEDSVVLDVGGNIGTFARYAFERGAGKVISVEPDPENFRLLTKNVKGFSHNNSMLIHAAATFEPMKTIELYVNGKTNKALHSTVPVRGRESITVPACTLAWLLSQEKPSVVKIDVEGAEYDLLKTKLPKFVEHLAVEWHLTKRGHRELASKYHYALVTEHKFHAMREPDFTTGAWTQMGIYAR
jgi:FkbM family methyltransferase